MPTVDTIIRDIRSELAEVPMEPVVMAAVGALVQQVGKGKVSEYAVRIAGAFIEELRLPLDGAIARRAALPAVKRFVDDALEALK